MQQQKNTEGCLFSCFDVITIKDQFCKTMLHPSYYFVNFIDFNSFPWFYISCELFVLNT